MEKQEEGTIQFENLLVKFPTDQVFIEERGFSLVVLSVHCRNGSFERFPFKKKLYFKNHRSIIFKILGDKKEALIYLNDDNYKKICEFCLKNDMHE
jgi:hypothetical protein